MAIAHGLGKLPDYQCSRCGATEIPERFSSRSRIAILMREKHICYRCAYWELFFQEHTKDIEIVNGEVFTYGKQMFTVLAHKLPINIRYIVHLDKTAKQLNNCFSLGILPDTISKGDTGKFVSRDIYKIMEDCGNYSCRAIGCYDRYRCWWYDKELREQHGPFNEIPKSYKIGSEGCESFIDKETMFNTDK